MKEESQIPQWLQDQENNSWQIELLISGGMIFTLYQLPAWINKKTALFDIETSLEYSLIIFIIGILVVSRALLIGFTINLLWFQRNHPFTNQEGFTTFVNIDTLPDGMNNLQINRLRILDDENDKIDTTGVRWIPFWIE